jgi:hypothetical protein
MIAGFGSVYAASASTPGCLSGPNAGSCGTQQNTTSLLVFDVYHQQAVSNNKVISYANSGADRATDFLITNPVSGPGTRNWKQFQYDPNGVPSGLCISDPGLSADNPLVLRGCNASKFQLFTTTYTPDGSNGFVWVNYATNNWVKDEGARNQLLGVRNPTSVVTDSVLWEFDVAPNGGNAS